MFARALFVTLALGVSPSGCTSSGGTGTTDAADSGSASTQDAAETSAASESGNSSESGAPADLGSGDCDIAAQDCPDGQKCVPYAENIGECCVDKLHCVPDEGDGVFGDSCTREAQTDDCAPKHFCLTTPAWGTGPGSCIEGCSSTSPCSDNSFLCLPISDEFSACTKLCHPFEAESCPQLDNEVHCYPSEANVFICAPSGADEGKGRDGDSCVGWNGCAEGFACVPKASKANCADEAEDCCSPMCDTSDPKACGPGEECSPLTDIFRPGAMDVGVCVLP